MLLWILYSTALLLIPVVPVNKAQLCKLLCADDSSLSGSINNEWRLKTIFWSFNRKISLTNNINMPDLKLPLL